MAAGFSCRRSSCRRVADFCWRERLWLKLWATTRGDSFSNYSMCRSMQSTYMFLILAIWCNLHVLWCIFGIINRLQQKHRVLSSCVSSYLNSAPLGQGETMKRADPRRSRGQSFGEFQQDHVAVSCGWEVEFHHYYDYYVCNREIRESHSSCGICGWVYIYVGCIFFLAEIPIQSWSDFFVRAMRRYFKVVHPEPEVSIAWLWLIPAKTSYCSIDKSCGYDCYGTKNNLYLSSLMVTALSTTVVYQGWYRLELLCLAITSLLISLQNFVQRGKRTFPVIQDDGLCSRLYT